MGIVLDLFEILEVISTLLVLASGTGVDQTQPAPSSDQVVVMDVVDGDTVTVTDGRDVRLIGVDTPEVYGEVNPREFDADSRDCLDMYADKASQYAKEEVGGEEVELVGDPQVDNKGSYGRLLRYVERGNASLNYRLVENGYARVYTESDFSEEQRFLSAEQAARSNDLGLWQC